MRWSRARRVATVLLPLALFTAGCGPGWQIVPVTPAVPSPVRVETEDGQEIDVVGGAFEGDSVLVGREDGNDRPVRIPLRDIVALWRQADDGGTQVTLWVAGALVAALGALVVFGTPGGS